MKIKVLILALLMCFSLLACNKTEPTDGEEIDVLEEYTPSEAKYPFSDADLTKVNMNATFDVTQHTKDAGAAIQPYQLFADGMCLQRDAVNHIWGYAFDTNHIAIKLNEKVYYGNVDEYGDWHVYLPKLNAGGPYEMEIISEVGRKVISNVYIGEVYLFAGQSNMEWQIWISGDVMKELYTDPNVYNENIRLLHIGANPQMTPTQVLSKPINWQGATSETVRTFSAVAYVFGKKLQSELGCPVGLISTALGGTIIEHWLSRDNYVDVSSRYTPVIDNSHPVLTPCLGYNGVLFPLKGYTMRGVVWYQGCANTFGTENMYDYALKTFIEQCRKDYNNENLTFTVCELARYMQDPFAYSTINERINALAKRDERIVVARNLDLGNWFDIHPLDKRVVATRAVDETLRVFYGKDIDEPVYLKNYTFNTDGSVTLEMSEEVNLVNGTNGFEVYDGSKYSYECEVTCDKNIVTVKASFPIERIRYGFTCEMTNDIKNDVSKMVTVYDLNGVPLDLFQIKK